MTRNRGKSASSRPEPQAGEGSPIPGKELICEELRQGGSGTARLLAKRLGVAKADYKDFRARLYTLQEEGLLVRVPSESSGKWELPERTPLRVGRLQLDRRGSGFFRPADSSEDDIFVRSSHLEDAFPGDLVLLRLTSAARGDRLGEGRVVEVIERGRKLLRGTFWKGKEGGLVACDDPRMPSDVFISQDDIKGLEDGGRVLVRLTTGSRGRFPFGEVTLVLTNEDSLEADFAVVRAEFDLPVEHGKGVVEEAAALPAVKDGEAWPDRRDLRQLRTFTIDPKDARDFDDAVSLELLAGGKLRLGVHIADVSHYVQPGSLIDQSAEFRGTSIYLPGRVIPMLPERLANDLCSLRPDEDRLVKTAFLTFSSSGELLETELCRSVIRSHRRFTYGEALAILDSLEGKEVDSAELPPDREEYEEILARMAFLRDSLKDARTRRGALFLDLPQLKIRVSENGEVEGVDREQGDPAHSLIEEFMLAANEAVARYLIAQDLAILARVHPAPTDEKLADFRELLGALGFELRARPEVGDLQRLVDEVVGGPLAVTVQIGLLRTMGHAEYTPKADLHYALSTTAYCHFTSPIRRYPDLVVHQVLEEHLKGLDGGRGMTSARRAHWSQKVEGVAPHACKAERRAEDAERAMQAAALIRFLSPRLGDEMGGSIISIHAFGFFVRLDELPIEGLVPVATLSAYYEFDPSTQTLAPAGKARGQGKGRGRSGGKGRSRGQGRGGRSGAPSFRPGQRVRVKLTELNSASRQISFELAR